MSFPDANTIPTSLEENLLEELKAQLSRKFSNTFGGKLELANGVLLYENHIATGKDIYQINHKKDGSKSKSPNIHGNNFEILTAGQQNKDAILENSGETTYTTDQLAAMRKNGEELPNGIPQSLIKTHHPQVDTVTVDAKGQVIRTAQLKNCEDGAGAAKYLLDERYICTNYEDYKRVHEAKRAIGRPEKQLIPEDKWTAPDELVIPAGQRAALIEELEKLKNGNDPINAELAEKLLENTERISQTDGLARDDSYSPYKTIAIETAKDFGQRTAERTGKLMISELAMISVGGAVWEIRDEIRNPGVMSIANRMERLVLTIWNKLSNVAACVLAKDFILEIVNLVAGALANIFKSAKNFISLLGNKIREVWDALYNYLTGKITSFHGLVLTIMKSVATVGLAGLALLLEQQLVALGLPSVLAGILSASAAAVAIVLSNRGLEVMVLGLVASFSRAETAKIRADQVEAKCREVLPKMLEQREELEALTQKIHDEREAILASSFQTLNSPQGRADVNVAISALERINQAFGATLGFSSFDEFDELMLADGAMRL